MKVTHLAEALLVRGLAAGLGALDWRAAHRVGERLGDLARALGLRRRVAEDNLARAFPERDAAARAAILAEHYRELGRTVTEYPRHPELVAADGAPIVREIRGREHLEAARARGRGVILLTGHYGNFELLGAVLGRTHPVDFIVKPLSNPAIEAWVAELRRRAGVGTIALGSGVRGAFAALRANRWVAMVADQDARRHGVFVPFLGRPASTPTGPAELSLRTGAPIVMGFASRLPDGRIDLDIQPPLLGEGDGREAVRDLTALHTAALEAWVRKHPEMWFWLHRRWKTAPAAEG